MDWMMAHPWMTFFLLMTVLECVSNVVANICRAIAACKYREADSKEESDN